MKPAPFAYRAPESIEETLAVLAEHGEEAKVLAGGQSLMPLLNLRMSRPAMLVDINRLGSLAQLRRTDGTLRTGALTREALLERSALVAKCWPLLAEAARFVGHPAIRNRGTVGGSVAHADPAAELPVALAALGSRFHLRSAHGARSCSAEDFFVTHLTTTLEPDELLIQVEVPPLPPGTGSAFTEYSRSHGDFALAGAAAVLTLGENGRCSDAALVLLGAGSTPVRAGEAEIALVGSTVDERLAAEVAQLAARQADPPSPGDHRRALLGELSRRALLRAAARARAVK